MDAIERFVRSTGVPEALEPGQYLKIPELAGPRRHGAVFLCPTCGGMVVVARHNSIDAYGMCIPEIRHGAKGCGYRAWVMLEGWEAPEPVAEFEPAEDDEPTAA